MMLNLTIILGTLMLASSLSSARIIQEEASGDDSVQATLANSNNNGDSNSGVIRMTKAEYVRALQHLAVLGELAKDLTRLEAMDIERSRKLDLVDAADLMEPRAIKEKPKRKTFFVGRK